MAEVTIQYWAAAKAGGGVAEESVEAGTLAEALDEVVAGAGPVTGGCGPSWPPHRSWLTAWPRAAVWPPT